MLPPFLRGGGVEIVPQAAGGATAMMPKNGLSGSSRPQGSVPIIRALSSGMWMTRISLKSSGSAPASGRMAL